MIGLLLGVSLAYPSRAQQSAPKLDALKQQAAAETDKLQTFTQQLVDQIFSFSEPGFQEYETARYVTALLEKGNFKVEREVAGIPTAWTATYGSGRPVIAFITEIDCIPRASQKPGVAYQDPIVAGAPGHGEGHNSGRACTPQIFRICRDAVGRMPWRWLPRLRIRDRQQEQQ